MRNFLLYLTMVFLLNTMFMAQTLVNANDGELTAAIDAAADGDVLQLLGGAEYTISDSSSFATIIGKNITIEGDPSVDELPIIKFLSSQADEPKFFLLGHEASLTLRKVLIDGNINGVAKVSNVINFDYDALGTDVSNIKKISFQDCEVKNITDNVIHAMNSNMKYIVLVDSTFINNSIMHETGSIIMYKYCGSNYIEVTNSTFYNVASYGLRVTGTETTGFIETPAALIDHTTWNNIGTTDPREVLLCEDGVAQPWTVTNNIFANQVSTSKTVVNLKEWAGDPNEITNNLFWVYGKFAWNDNIVSDTLKVDPQFADPDNGDFTIPAGNEALTYSTTGGAIGDPRWAVNATDLESNDILPTNFALRQNYPNPFNPTTNIIFDIVESEYVTLKVFDVLGREVRTLVNENLGAGSYSYNFDARNLPSGVYVYTLSAGNNIQSRKMLLMK